MPVIKKDVYSESFWNLEEIQEIWNKDKLNRKQAAQILTKVISKIEWRKLEENSFSSVVIKSPWGTGKTFFTQNWKETLEKAGFFTVYF